jgi:hypothetical protein
VSAILLHLLIFHLLHLSLHFSKFCFQFCRLSSRSIHAPHQPATPSMAEVLKSFLTPFYSTIEQ